MNNMMKLCLLLIAFIAATVTVTAQRLSAADFELQAENVCFGAAGTSFGAFTVKKSGIMTAIKLKYKSGAVTCKFRSDGLSHWGCGGSDLDTVVTTAADKVVFPENAHIQHGYYQLAGYDSNSSELILENPTENNNVSKGQTLRLWYGEDLFTWYTEGDNSGITCADVYANFLPDFQLQAENVSFKPVVRSYGKVNVTTFTAAKSGKMTAIKLVHENEAITCRRGTVGLLNWGCGNQDFNIVVTTNTGEVYLNKHLLKDGKYRYYFKAGLNSEEKDLICNSKVKQGQTLQLWWDREFETFFKSDNKKTLADVYADIQ